MDGEPGSAKQPTAERRDGSSLGNGQGTVEERIAGLCDQKAETDERFAAEKNALLSKLTSATDEEQISAIRMQIAELDKQTAESDEKFAAEMKALLSEIPPEDYSTKVMLMLFAKTVGKKKGWAQSYDPHMYDTGHDPAVEGLMINILEVDRLKVNPQSTPIIGKRILEMSGGTGTVIDILYRNMLERNRSAMIKEQKALQGLGESDEIASDVAEKIHQKAVEKTRAELDVTLNDASEDMKQLASKKLEGKCDVKYTGQDLRALDFPRWSVDTLILSQTLHLITDPALLALEREPKWLQGETDHIEAKLEAIRRGFHALAPGGHFILVDEWPAVLSNNPVKPLDEMVSILFKATFRPVADRTIMGNALHEEIPEAKFVAELKMPIDKHHSMYALVYEKGSVEREREALPVSDFKGDTSPDNDETLPKEVKERHEAESRIVGAFQDLDVQFITAYRRMNGGQYWQNFEPLKLDQEHHLRLAVIREIAKKPEEQIECIMAQLKEEKAKPEAEKRFNSITISQVLHWMEPDQRKEFIESAIDALKLGGALVIVDEWKPPAGMPHPIENDDFRSRTMGRFQKRTRNRIIFEAALKTPIVGGYEASNMCGYVYRKITTSQGPQLQAD
ncbi:MAG: class I SAM-dependent methyltransferase [Candidatus ainarchaeum sp.]|nr:class I SAM-dependent methyltransferase [Candidatus ainarchaeum sp.]